MEGPKRGAFFTYEKEGWMSQGDGFMVAIGLFFAVLLLVVSPYNTGSVGKE